jgi:hypothetical protein
LGAVNVGAVVCAMAAGASTQPNIVAAHAIATRRRRGRAGAAPSMAESFFIKLQQNSVP